MSLNPAQPQNMRLNALKWVQFVLFSCVLLYLGKALFVPLLFGLLVALITYPISKKLETHGWPRGLSITLLLVAVVLLFCTLIWLLSVQINVFLGDLPRVSERITKMSPDVQKWINTSFGVTPADQTSWLHRLSQNMDTEITVLIKSVFNATISTVIMLVMIPIYAALFLYHRETFVHFLEALVGSRYKVALHEVLSESVLSYFRFVKGNFYVYVIVGVLNSLGLLALGIPHALLYGMLTSFMMVIPYVGIFISASIPVSIALVTRDSVWYPIGVVVIFVFIQYLESNVIFPRVVGEQLNLSTWATLVAIVAATIIWGLSGMVLITPFLAILKIMSDHVPEWKALNILLNRSEGYGEKRRKTKPLPSRKRSAAVAS